MVVSMQKEVQLYIRVNKFYIFLFTVNTSADEAHMT